MPLVGLLAPLDTADNIRRWSFAHAQDHNEIDAALEAKGISSPQVPLDPMPPLEDAATWLALHQQKHNTMNQSLGLTGDDLTQFDLSDGSQRSSFAGTNFSEHTSVHDVLGI